MLAIVEYGAGNQTSVSRALNYLGIDNKITDQPQALLAADGIIFPGVGAAGQAMRALAERGLDRVLKEAVARGLPLLGICLGCQIMLDYSEEDETSLLGLVPGNVARFKEDWREENGKAINIPHMGWNSLKILKASPLLEGIDERDEFYFVHGYYTRPQKELSLAMTRYGEEFCSVFGRDGLWAVQFHPEKSGAAGLRLLANFNNWCKLKKAETLAI